MSQLAIKYKQDTHQISYQLAPSESLNVQEIALLENPGLSSVSQVQFIKRWGRTSLVWKLHTQMTLSDYIDREIGVRDCLTIIDRLAHLLVQFTTIQLEYGMLILDEKYIFIDKITKAVTMLYLPVIPVSKKYNVSYFFSQFFQHLRSKSQQHQVLAEQYLVFIENGKVFHSEEFMKFHIQIKERYQFHQEAKESWFERKPLSDRFFQRK